MDLYEYYESISVDQSNIALEFTSKSYTELDLETFDKLFIVTIEQELNKIISIQSKYQSIGNRFVVNKSLEVFFKKIYTISCPKILKHGNMIQQIYMLHIFAVLLIRYNKRVLKFSEEDFINNIFIPNIMTACAKQLINARRLIHRLIRDAYIVVEQKSQDIINFYVELHHVEPTVIKNDIIYLFLRNILIQFDPLEMENVEQLYSTVIHRMFFFYLKARTAGKIDHGFDQSFIYEDIGGYPSQRYHIYEEALYLTQIQMMCKSSTSIHQISKQYDKLKDIVIPNEVQKLYLFSLNKGYYITDKKKLAVMKIHNDNSHMEYLKNNLPTMYRLLRSIHVISDSSHFLENDIQKLKELVYNTLYNRFKFVLDDSVIIPILRRITDNLVLSLTTGEFIDMLTLTSVSITGDKFMQQLEKFLELILSEVGLNDVST